MGGDSCRIISCFQPFKSARLISHTRHVVSNKLTNLLSILGHISLRLRSGWRSQSGRAASCKHTWGKAPTCGTGSSSDLVQLSLRVPLTEKTFLYPGLTATTGLSWPQHMGPHMLPFTHSCLDEAHTPSDLTQNDAPPTHDTFIMFKNTFFSFSCDNLRHCFSYFSFHSTN